MNLNTLSLKDKIGQLLVASLDGDPLDEAAQDFLAKSRIGNLVHFGNNVKTREQTLRLNADCSSFIESTTGIRPLITIDHEGGRVMRFQSGTTWFPSAMAVAAAGDARDAYRLGEQMGRELSYLGFHINYAPTLDVNTNPLNPIIGLRSYGDTPERVSTYGLAVIKGMQDGGVMPAAKHFPGHGDTAIDSHYGLPLVNRPATSIEAVELAPFQAAIDAGLPAIMTTHILFPTLDDSALPATMAPKLMTDLLRVRMGFDGLIITDALHMDAIRKHFGVARGAIEALKAGCDLLCVGTGGAGFYASQQSAADALLAAVESGEIPMARVDESLARIEKAKIALCFQAPVPPEWEIGDALAKRIAERSLTLYGGLTCLSEGTIRFAGEPLSELRYGVGEGDPRLTSACEWAARAADAPFTLLTDGLDPSSLLSEDTLVLCVTRMTARERAAIDWALSSGQRVVVACVALPYAAVQVPVGVPCVLTYGVTPASMHALVQALSGRIPVTGQLPVHIQ